MNNFRILVDADACPVKSEIIAIAKSMKIKVIMLVDDSHLIRDNYSEVITVEKGPDSVDFKLIEVSQKGDIVVTQDYGVATMALSKGAHVINQNGLIYNDFNINQLLMDRHVAQKSRRQGKRTKGPKKRKNENNNQFKESFLSLCSSCLNEIE